MMGGSEREPESEPDRDLRERVSTVVWSWSSTVHGSHKTRVKIISECGHLPQIEQTEAFLEGVLEITNGTRP